MNYNPCQKCSGEDCVCCAYYLENRENQPNAEIDPEELEMLEDLEGLRDLSENLRKTTDYEKDTPLGQAYGDGFDDAFYGND